MYQAKDYDDVHERWTRHGKLIRDIGTVLEMWATYKSWDFRQAYIEAYGELYGVPESERRALRQAQLEAARASYEFHVVAQSTEYDWNNLHEEDTVWKIALADAANREIPPTSVKLEKLPDLYEMRFFPNRTYFSRSYTIKFPRGAAEGERRFTGSQSGLLLLLPGRRTRWAGSRRPGQGRGRPAARSYATLGALRPAGARGSTGSRSSKLSAGSWWYRSDSRAKKSASRALNSPEARRPAPGLTRRGAWASAVGTGRCPGCRRPGRGAAARRVGSGDR